LLPHARPSPPFPYTTLFRSAVRSVLDHRDRAARWREQFGVARRREPVHHLTLDTQFDRVIVEEVRRPGAGAQGEARGIVLTTRRDRKSTRLNSSHQIISYAV